MFDTPLNIDGATIYRFRVIGNYDDGVIGAAGTALDNEKTKFLVCVDVAEQDNSTHPRHGYRYLVMRPKYLWNATSPSNFTGATDSTGEDPINPKYSENDEIEALGLFAESIHHSESLTYSTDLRDYIGTFNSSGTPVMNWEEISGPDSTIRLYFLDLNIDARNRNATGGSAGGLRYLPVWL